MIEDSTLTLRTDDADEASLKYILKLAAPMIVMNISFTVMQFVDRFMVSRLGTEALAAILPASIVSFLPSSFLLGVMTSVNTFVSQSLGREKYRDCSNYCWQVIYMGLIYTVIVVSIMWPAAPYIFKLINPGETAVIAMEVTYLRIMLYAHLLAVLIWASSQFFMGIHRPIIIMYGAIAGQVVNVSANYLLIFGKFGFPKMGIAGAAWGTFLGIIIGMIIRMGMFLSSGINAKFHSRSSMNIDLRKMKDLLKIGLPAGIGLMINVTFWGIILLWLVGNFGKEAMAASSAVFSCLNVSVMPIVGLGTALTAAVGKAIGQAKHSLARKQARICLKIAMFYMGLMGLCFFLFRDSIMDFWSSDKNVTQTGSAILICAAIFQIFDAATITYSGALRGAGDTVWLASVSATGAVIILGGGGLLMLKFFPQLGPLGPWIAATVNIIMVGLANRWRFKSNAWTKIDLFKRRPVGVPVEIETAVD